MYVSADSEIEPHRDFSRSKTGRRSKSQRWTTGVLDGRLVFFVFTVLQVLHD